MTAPPVADPPAADRAPIDLDAYLRGCPKVELHCHLVGALRLATLVELAARHGRALPRPAETLYRYRDFYDFIDTFRLASAVLRDADDFARAAYEAVEDGVRSGGLRHVELFFNPDYFLREGVAWRTQIEGLVAGLAAAERDHGASWLLVPSIDREWPAADALEVVERIAADRHERIAGIGLDGPERAGPPAGFAAAFARAARAGLRRTAHVCEDNQTLAEAPPSNVADCLDLLRCDRLDHGYHVTADAAMVERARAAGVAFTVCGRTSVSANAARRLEGIRRMADAGLALTLNTDDPAMFGTDLGETWVHVHRSLGWGAAEARRLALTGVDACWLDAADRTRLRAEFVRAFDALDARLDGSASALR